MTTAITSLPLSSEIICAFTPDIFTKVQRLAARNYARHRETQASKRQVISRELQETVSDPLKHRDYLLDAAMIRSREREQAIE